MKKQKELSKNIFKDISFQEIEIKSKISMIEEILNHRFNTFSADTALMLGNQKLSTVNKKIVIEWQEIADYLIKTKSQLTDIWKQANNK